MRFISLFAGVGGFDLGLERAGWERAAQVELDKRCREVLTKHWPDVPKHDDINTFKWADFRGKCVGGSDGFTEEGGPVDLVCGGFPCQDVSVAGRRAGLAGERTGLFWQAVRIIQEVSPEWVLLENVPGLLSSNQGRDFGIVLNALADSGFPYVEWRVLDSQFFGVAQRRRRVFIVAGRRDPRCGQVLSEPEGRGGDSAAGREAGTGASRVVTVSTLQGGDRGRGWRLDAEGAAGNQIIPVVDGAPADPNGMREVAGLPGRLDGVVTAFPGVAGTLTTRIAKGINTTMDDGAMIVTILGERTHTLTAEGADASEGGTGRGTPIVAFHATQDPISSESVSPRLGVSSYVGVAHRGSTAILDPFTGDPAGQDGARYRAMGNAVTVPVIEWIGRRLALA